MSQPVFAWYIGAIFSVPKAIAISKAAQNLNALLVLMNIYTSSSHPRCISEQPPNINVKYADDIYFFPTVMCCLHVASCSCWLLYSSMKTMLKNLTVVACLRVHSIRDDQWFAFIVEWAIEGIREKVEQLYLFGIDSKKACQFIWDWCTIYYPTFFSFPTLYSGCTHSESLHSSIPHQI